MQMGFQIPMEGYQGVGTTGGKGGIVFGNPGDRRQAVVDIGVQVEKIIMGHGDQ
jgi:hypothetical protein